MSDFLLIGAWWLAGFLPLVLVGAHIGGVLTLSDVVISAILGWLGPFGGAFAGLVWLLFATDECVIWKRKR